MTLVEVIVAMLILTGVVLTLGTFSARFAQANGQAHLVMTANDIAVARLDDTRTQPTYASLNLLATTDTVAADNTKFVRVTRVKQYGSELPPDSINYKLITVIVTHIAMRKAVSKTTAVAAF